MQVVNIVLQEIDREHKDSPEGRLVLRKLQTVHVPGQDRPNVRVV